MPRTTVLTASGPGVDAFSYHFYGGVSQRCKMMGPAMQTTPEAALTNAWLSLTDRDEAFYATLRDRFEPGKPLWLTETGETACGGNPWASDFIDSFRYLNQLGTLAQKGVQVVMHNTLVASDYGLLHEDTYEPKPNYWASLLWNRTMGTVVLDPGTPKDQAVRVYAQCAKAGKGGVTVLALNRDSAHEQSITLPRDAERYTLTAPDLLSDKTLLNGAELKAESDGSVAPLKGVHAGATTVKLEPASVTFFLISSAHNPACK